MPTVADLRAALDAAYPPGLAESWDTGIGLTCGDPATEVDRVLLAVDADAGSVAEAVELGAQLLVTHHPLLFRPVQSIATDTAKGALLHRLVRSGVAHVACHTNADKAVGGVSDALAGVLGLIDARPLQPDPQEARDKLVVFAPRPATPRLLEALSAAGAGRLGDYTDASFVGPGVGRFRPGPAAHPAVGRAGVLEAVEEDRIEVILPRRIRAAVLDALLRHHPYEEPAYDLLELAAGPGPTGMGRLGRLDRPLSLRAFVDRVAGALPRTAAGVQAAGDPERPVAVGAVCGGAGGSLLPAASAAGADVLVTSDLDHHEVAEHLARPGAPAVVRVAHWAGEWPWLARAASVLTASGAVRCVVSRRCSDPWTDLAAAGPPTSGVGADAGVVPDP